MFGSLKSKMFTETAGILLPLFLLLGLFLFWNGDLIMSKFGFETRSSLKAQVASLQKDISALQEKNEDLSKELTSVYELIGITDNILSAVIEQERDTFLTVSELLEKRRKLASSYLDECGNIIAGVPSSIEMETSPVNTVRPTSSSEIIREGVTVTRVQPTVRQTPPHPEQIRAVRDELSKINIRAIHEAYDLFQTE